jgi:hypothetical protein
VPNRIIKESINESKGLSSCTLFAQDLFKRLITYADDYGRFNADSQIILARLYPRDIGIIGQQDIIEALIELTGSDKIRFYTAQPKKEIYGCFPSWGDHQRIRESRRCFPEPCDTSVNDWYMRRFVSIDMKAEIIERDGFKCQICGKFLTTCKDAKRFVKLSCGLYHIDHIVPCQQGGRATLENLQLTCPTCNLSRKRFFTFEEIVEFAFSNKLAENRGESQQNAASCARAQNPIQSNPILEVSNDTSLSETPLPPLPEPPEICPYQEITGLYNELCPSFPGLRSLSEARRKAINARWKQYGRDISAFRTLFAKAEASSFLKGGNNRNFTATFDWLLKDANMAKTIDGNYDSRKEPEAQPTGNRKKFKLEVIDGKEVAVPIET